MTATALANQAQPTQITSDQALRIARLDAEKIYRDMASFRVQVDLQFDPARWHVDFELKNRQSQGGGAHYIIDGETGKILSKKDEQ